MFIAEREGFEPPVPLSTTVFKTVVIDHSTISPCGKTCLLLTSRTVVFCFVGAKIGFCFMTGKFLCVFLF